MAERRQAQGNGPAPRNWWLVAGGWLSLAAAALHVAVIAGGPDWYRFYGAGEAMARLAERGDWRPAAITLFIASVLVLWAAYAFAGAGLIRRMPFMRSMLVVISAIFLLRGLMVLLPAFPGRPDLSPQFMLWSSLIVLVYGICYALGTWRAWPYLSKRKVSHALGS
jgi:hypothetical protein